MPIAFQCPSCRVRLTVPETYAGKKATCNKCGSRLVIPAGKATDEEPLDVLPASQPSSPHDNPFSSLGSAESDGGRTFSQPQPNGIGVGVLMNWGCSVLLLLAGLGVFALFLFSPRSGVTPEKELTSVEGVPTNVRVTPHKGNRGHTWYCVECTVGGQTFQWLSSDPNYEAVRAAVQSGRPVRAWVSPKQAALSGTVPLYKFGQDDTIILDYATVAAKRRQGEGSGLICGGVVLLLGILGILLSAFQTYRSRARP